MKKKNIKLKSPKLPKSTKEKVDIAIRWAFGVILFIYSLTLLIPIVWMLINSLKDPIEYYLTTAFDLPKTFYFDNYKFIIDNMKYTVNNRYGTGTVTYNIPWMLFYSLIWSIGQPGFKLIITVMTAYVMAKYKFPGRKFIYQLGIVVMILPIIGSSGSALILRRKLGVYNNMLLTILTGPSGEFSGMHFLMFYAAFKSISWEYAEAAFMDGASHFRVFITIMFPMVTSTFWVLLLLTAITTWNDYSSFLYWLPSYANIAIGVYKFQYTSRLELGTTMPQILASFVLVSIPITALYLASQKLITANFMVGGLKG